MNNLLIILCSDCCPWLIKSIGTLIIVLLTGTITLYGYNLQITKNRRVQWIKDIREAFAELAGKCTAIIPATQSTELRELSAAGWKVIYMLSPRLSEQNEMRNRVGKLIMAIMANDENVPNLLQSAGDQLDNLIAIEEDRLKKLWIF